MTDFDTYPTKHDPYTSGWLAYNGPLLDALRSQSPASQFYMPLADVELRAASEGNSPEGLLARLQREVGPLGSAALELEHVESSDSWNIVLRSAADA